VILLRALLALTACVASEALLGAFFPAIHRWVDPMILPLIWYALRGKQRGAMLAGCGGGLLQDAWFQAGLFGTQGLCKTVLAWALGAIASRVEMNVLWGRATSGVLVPVLGDLLETGVRRLFDQSVLLPDPLDLAIRGAVGGLLVPLVFAIVQRVPGMRDGRRTGRRRA
jgi:rod shape-determining protein MreD